MGVYQQTRELNRFIQDMIRQYSINIRSGACGGRSRVGLGCEKGGRWVSELGNILLNFEMHNKSLDEN